MMQAAGTYHLAATASDGEDVISGTPVLQLKPLQLACTPSVATITVRALSASQTGGVDGNASDQLKVCMAGLYRQH